MNQSIFKPEDDSKDDDITIHELLQWRNSSDPSSHHFGILQRELDDLRHILASTKNPPAIPARPVLDSNPDIESTTRPKREVNHQNIPTCKGRTSTPQSRSRPSLKKDLERVTKFKEVFTGDKNQNIEAFYGRFESWCRSHGHNDRYKSPPHSSWWMDNSNSSQTSDSRKVRRYRHTLIP